MFPYNIAGILVHRFNIAKRIAKIDIILIHTHTSENRSVVAINKFNLHIAWQRLLHVIGTQIIVYGKGKLLHCRTIQHLIIYFNRIVGNFHDSITKAVFWHRQCAGHHALNLSIYSIPFPRMIVTVDVSNGSILLKHCNIIFIVV